MRHIHKVKVLIEVEVALDTGASEAFLKSQLEKSWREDYFKPLANVGERMLPSNATVTHTGFHLTVG